MHGQDYKVHVQYQQPLRPRPFRTPPGSRVSSPFVKRRHAETDSEWSRERYEGYMREVPCPQCGGARLKPESLAVQVGGQSISQICALAIADCAKFLAEVDFTSRERQIAERVIKEIEARLGFLLDVGLDYLSLDRPAGTLSGGEAQRIRLATQIGSGLVGVLYVLDEPSIGLHQRDNHRLIETLTRLRDLGNTVIVVEHDQDTITAADWVVDIGPGAGEHGGNVVHSGSVEDLLEPPGLHHRRVSLGSPRDPDACGQAPAGPGAWITVRRRSRAQPAMTSTSSFPLGSSRRGHRGLAARASRRWSTTSSTWCSRTSSTARDRCPAGTRASRARAPRQGRARRPGADRADPAAQPRDVHRCLRQHAQALRRDDRGEDPGLPARVASRSTSRAVAATTAQATAPSRSR